MHYKLLSIGGGRVPCLVACGIVKHFVLAGLDVTTNFEALNRVASPPESLLISSSSSESLVVITSAVE